MTARPGRHFRCQVRRKQKGKGCVRLLTWTATRCDCRVDLVATGEDESEFEVERTLMQEETEGGVMYVDGEGERDAAADAGSKYKAWLGLAASGVWCRWQM